MYESSSAVLHYSTGIEYIGACSALICHAFSSYSSHTLIKYFLTRLVPVISYSGQLVSLELIDTDDSTCPVELLAIPVPTCDAGFDPECTGDKYLPYERIAYDKRTGQSPNSPRKQVCSQEVNNGAYFLEYQQYTQFIIKYIFVYVI